MSADTTNVNSIDEIARRQFELAWREGRPELIEKFLAGAGGPTYLTTLEELITIELEFVWKARAKNASGSGVTLKHPLGSFGRETFGLVEDYLTRFPCLNQEPIRLRLIQQEYLVRNRHGDRPAPSEYQRRFPDVAANDPSWERLLNTPALSPATGSVAGDVHMGRYRLCAEHARGGFGLVWRAEDQTLGREVAVKQLSHLLAGEPNFRQRFVAEARIAAQLQHPGIVPVYDLGDQEAECPSYTMKLVRGQTLSEAIRRFHEDPLTTGERALEHLRLLNAFLAVTRAMAYAHARGVIHRDLKPDNILLGDFGETVILDWGLAKIRHQAEAAADAPAAGTNPQATQQGTILGTPMYMAPEQATGRIDEVDERSDIYSLGVILYQLLTGRTPFRGDSTEEVLAQVVQAEPPPPRSLLARVPRPLEAICLHAMAKRPEDRYAKMGLLTRDLERFLADEPVTAYRARWTERLGRWARRHRTLVVSGCVAFLLLLAGAVTGLFIWQEQEQERDRQEQVRRQQEEKALANRRSSAKTQELLGLKAVGLSRFQTAEEVFREAVKGLGREPRLAELRLRIQAHENRVRRINEFTRLADEAERLAFLEQNDEAATKCRQGLDQLGVQPNDLKWFDHVAAVHLQPEQLKQLKEDIYRILMLAAGVHFKRGNHTDQKKSTAALRESLEAAHMVQNFRRSQTAAVIEFICRLRLLDFKRQAPPPPQPTAAADYYYFGMVHFALSAMTHDPNVKVLLPLLPQNYGVDVKTPLATSRRLLSNAAAMAPKHYWTHFWLGWSLAANQRPRVAEQAFNTCIALRPNYGFAYSQRAMTLLRQLEQRFFLAAQMGGMLAPGPRGCLHHFHVLILQSHGPERPTLGEDLRELKRRMRDDFDQAVKFEPHEPHVQWEAGNGLAWLGDMAKARKCWAKFLDFEQPRRAYKGQPNYETIGGQFQQLRNFLVWLLEIDGRNSENCALLAHVFLALDQFQDAERAARRALELRPDHPRALAVRGAVRLRRKEFAGAKADLERALRKDPRNYLASLSLARLHEARQQYREALRAYDAFLEIALQSWQRFEAHLASARTLKRLGCKTEARQALEQARLINPYEVPKQP